MGFNKKSPFNSPFTKGGRVTTSLPKGGGAQRRWVLLNQYPLQQFNFSTVLPVGLVNPTYLSPFKLPANRELPRKGHIHQHCQSVHFQYHPEQQAGCILRKQVRQFQGHHAVSAL